MGSVFVSLLYLLTSYYLVIGQILLGLIVCAFRDVVFSITFVLVLGGILNIFGMFIGLVFAPAAAYFSLLLYVRLRYGREDCPLLLSRISDGGKEYLFNLHSDPDEIINTQKEIESALKTDNIDKKTINRVALLIEEMYLIIRKMNDDKPVLCECSVFLNPDGVQIISKDNGVSFDMADEDISTVSLSAYIVASYLEEKTFDNRHLTTMGFNRSSFFIRYDESGVASAATSGAF